MFEKNIGTVIICHPIFDEREIGSTVILKLFITIVAWVFNNLGLKMYSIWGSRVLLNIPHFKYFSVKETSTPTLLKFQGYFPTIYTYQTFATFWVKRTKKLAAF